MKLLLRKWPEGVPTPKQGIPDEALQQIDDIVGLVEKEHGLQFVPPTYSEEGNNDE